MHGLRAKVIPHESKCRAEKSAYHSAVDRLLWLQYSGIRFDLGWNLSRWKLQLRRVSGFPASRVGASLENGLEPARVNQWSLFASIVLPEFLSKAILRQMLRSTSQSPELHLMILCLIEESNLQ